MESTLGCICYYQTSFYVYGTVDGLLSAFVIVCFLELGLCIKFCVGLRFETMPLLLNGYKIHIQRMSLMKNLVTLDVGGIV